jgi:hypothetical protein
VVLPKPFPLQELVESVKKLSTITTGPVLGA